MRTVLRLLGWTMLAAITAWLIWWQPWRWLPPQWDPWEPLAIEHPMTFVSKWKLGRLADEPERCLDILQRAPDGAISYTALEDYTPVAGCPLSNVVRISRTGLTYNSSFTLACPLAVAWVMFERQQLQPLAEQHLGARVARVDHFGSFACRNIYNRDNARKSQHASANALDVAAFRTADGRRISVLDDWDNSRDKTREDFLREVHSRACGYFGTVLGPDYNQPHENHFHLEGGSFGICR